MSELPAAIDATLQGRARNTDKQSYDGLRQTTVFLYDHGNLVLELGSFEGPLRVPAVGETVTLWDTTNPLVVTKVTSHYGLSHPDPVQHVSVTVYVDVPK